MAAAAAEAPVPLLRLPLAANALRVVLRDTRTAHWVEPVPYTVPRSRWEVRASLPVELPEDEGEEEEEELEPSLEESGEEG